MKQKIGEAKEEKYWLDEEIIRLNSQIDEHFQEKLANDENEEKLQKLYDARVINRDEHFNSKITHNFTFKLKLNEKARFKYFCVKICFLDLLVDHWTGIVFLIFQGFWLIPYKSIHHKNVPCEILYISMYISKTQLQNPMRFLQKYFVLLPFWFCENLLQFTCKA